MLVNPVYGRLGQKVRELKTCMDYRESLMPLSSPNIFLHPDQFPLIFSSQALPLSQFPKGISFNKCIAKIIVRYCLGTN